MIDKDMVKPSLGLWAGTIHEALELKTAIGAALKSTTGLREMEMEKQKIQEPCKHRRFNPSDEFITYKILKKAEYLTSAFKLV